MRRLLVAAGVVVFVAAIAVLRREDPPTGPRGATGAMPQRQEAAAMPPAHAVATNVRATAIFTADIVDGTIVDAAGQPVADAEVTGVPEPPAAAIASRTDAHGAFALRGLPPQPLRLIVQHRDFLLANEPVAVAQRESLRIVVHRAPIVRGRVVDAVRGAPMPRFWVALAALPEGRLFAVSTPPPGAQWLQRDDGAFAIAAETVGPHALQVFTEHGCVAQVRLDLRPDDVVDQDVRVEPGIGARGVVRDARGSPVAGALVTLHPQPQGPGVAATTSVDGTFALPPVPAGDYGIVVEPLAQPLLRRSDLRLLLTVPDPFFELQLPPGAAVAGTVTPWRAGQLAEVVLAHADGPVRKAPVDAATGTFALADLTPGVHRVFVERREPVWRSRVAHQLFDLATAPSIDLLAGATGHFDPVDPTATMARLRGLVVGHRQPDRLLVRAFREDQPMPDRVNGLFRAVPAQDGSFELDGFVPGRWRLQVMSGAEVLCWDVVDLAANADLEHVLQVPVDRSGR